MVNMPIGLNVQTTDFDDDSTKDIVDRLRAFRVGNPGPNTKPYRPPICAEAANLITLLRSGNEYMCEELERLRALLAQRTEHEDSTLGVEGSNPSERAKIA